MHADPIFRSVYSAYEKSNVFNIEAMIHIRWEKEDMNRNSLYNWMDSVSDSKKTESYVAVTQARDWLYVAISLLHIY